MDIACIENVDDRLDFIKYIQELDTVWMTYQANERELKKEAKEKEKKRKAREKKENKKRQKQSSE